MVASTTDEHINIRGYIRRYDADYKLIEDEIQGSTMKINPLSRQFFCVNQQSLDEGNNFSSSDTDKQEVAQADKTVTLVDHRENSELTLSMVTSVENNEELTMTVKLMGSDAALNGQQVLIYAQVEDPAEPGIFDSWSCAVTVQKQSLGFTRPKDLQIMNYNGDGSFKGLKPFWNNNSFYLDD